MARPAERAFATARVTVAIMHRRGRALSILVVLAAASAVSCVRPVPEAGALPQDFTAVYGRGVDIHPAGRPYLEVVEDCERYGLEACFEVSARIDAEGQTGERHQRIGRYYDGCENRHFAADCYRLGAMQQNERDLFVPMVNACTSGLPQACFALGVLFFNSGGHTTAFAAFRRACNDKYAPSCLWAGQMLEADTSQIHDPKQAAAFFTKGCNLGLAACCVAYRDLTCSRGWTTEGCAAP